MRPEARRNALTSTLLRASSPPSSSRTYTSALRRSPAISTRVRTAPAARGSFTSVARRDAISARTPSPTRRARVFSSPAIELSVHALPHRDNLRGPVREHGVTDGLDRVSDLRQHRVTNRSVRRHHAHTEDCELMQVLGLHLRDGHIEARSNAITHLLHDA